MICRDGGNDGDEVGPPERLFDHAQTPKHSGFSLTQLGEAERERASEMSPRQPTAEMSDTSAPRAI